MAPSLPYSSQDLGPNQVLPSLPIHQPLCPFALLYFVCKPRGNKQRPTKREQKTAYSELAMSKQPLSLAFGRDSKAGRRMVSCTLEKGKASGVLGLEAVGVGKKWGAHEKWSILCDNREVHI